QEVSVGKKPRIRLDEGPYILLRELLPQDRVEIQFKEADNVRSVTIAALRPAESSGKIKEVDPAGSKLIATLAADPQPQDVPMYVPSGAKLLLNARQVELADLAPDDRVKMTHLKDTQGRAARDVIRLEALRTVSTIGFVRETIKKDSLLLLEIGHLGKITQIEFADSCRVSINGQTEEEGKKFGPGDLKKGDRVEVKYDVKATSVSASRRESLTGATLLKVDPSAQVIVVQPDQREGTLAFTIGDDCQITRDEKQADFTDFRQGDVLDITFDPQTDGPGDAGRPTARRGNKKSKTPSVAPKPNAPLTSVLGRQHSKF